MTELCPPGCSCIKRPHNYSFEVSCPPATLNSLPYHLPNPNEPPPRHGRFDLRFAGSSMKFMESRDYFANTFRVDVSNSKIETITDEGWKSGRSLRKSPHHFTTSSPNGKHHIPVDSCPPQSSQLRLSAAMVGDVAEIARQRPTPAGLREMSLSRMARARKHCVTSRRRFLSKSYPRTRLIRA